MEIVFHWEISNNLLCIKAAGGEWQTEGWIEICEEDTGNIERIFSGGDHASRLHKEHVLWVLCSAQGDGSQEKTASLS